jgi:hypothetical protein
MMVTTRNIGNFHWTGLVRSCGKDTRIKQRDTFRRRIFLIGFSGISVPCSIQEGIKERKSRKDAQYVQKVGKR